MTVRIRVNPSFYTNDGDGQVNGWSNASPFKKAFAEYNKFALVIGKSADVVTKSNYDVHDETFGGSRAIVVNHVGSDIEDAVFHTLVSNPNQYDYIVQILDLMSRRPTPYIEVLRDGVALTATEVASFTIVP
jgi:hypothetical protein